MSETNTQASDKMLSVKHKDYNYNDFFQKFPPHLSMSEKVRLTCELYENNYFIGKELKELDDPRVTAVGTSVYKWEWEKKSWIAFDFF